MYGIIEEIAGKYKSEVRYNEPLNKYTTMKIGGPCDVMVVANSGECIAELIRACKDNDLPYYIMGKGSNILVSDKGLRAVVILVSNGFSDICVDGDIIVCDSGASLMSVCNIALDNCLSGLEFAYGIPGTIGGAVYMNAGAYGGEMKDVVVSCEYIGEDGELRVIPVSDMDLSYRHSVFSGGKSCVTSVTLRLIKGDKTEIRTKMNDYMVRRKMKQPLEYPSAGSTFKRPDGDYASRLIDISGLGGYTVGNAAVSDKHCGFLINKGNATFKEMTNLIKFVQMKVKEITGFDLECEVIILE